MATGLRPTSTSSPLRSTSRPARSRSRSSSNRTERSARRDRAPRAYDAPGEGRLPHRLHTAPSCADRAARSVHGRGRERGRRARRCAPRPPQGRRGRRSLAARRERRFPAAPRRDRPRPAPAGALRPRAQHWRLELPDTFDDFLASRSKSTRESVKRYGKRLEKTFGDHLSLGRARRARSTSTASSRISTGRGEDLPGGPGVAFSNVEEQRRRRDASASSAGGSAPGSSIVDGKPVASGTATPTTGLS